MREVFNELKSYDGRFRRSRYWSYHIGIKLVASILFLIIRFITIDIITLLLTLSIYMTSAYFYICLQIKRSHDLGKSGHFVWLTLIPIVNLYPAIMFAFVKGTDGPNEYGENPVW